MRHTCAFLSLVLIVITTAPLVLAGPGEDAVASYRAYVKAIREGRLEDAKERIEKVPPEQKELVDVSLKALIARDALKTVVVEKIGPTAPNADEGLLFFDQLSDDALKSLRAEVPEQEAEMIGVMAKLSPEGQEFPAAVMVKRDGKWVLPVMYVTQFTSPPEDVNTPELLQRVMEDHNAMRVASERVLGRVKKGEIKTHAGVVEALTIEKKRAGGM